MFEVIYSIYLMLITCINIMLLIRISKRRKDIKDMTDDIIRRIEEEIGEEIGR